MHWLQTIDNGLLQLINQSLRNPFFDQLMPFVSGTSVSYGVLGLLLAVGVLVLLWKGGLRGVVFLLMLVVALAVADGVVCHPLKHLIGRPRPFSGTGSMPSSHAANCFAATLVAFIYYRRTVWVALPLALLVGYSRIYNGVHYPSDVLAGMILGAGSAAGVVWSVNTAWRWVGQKWFPLWWEAVPNLVQPEFRRAVREEGELESEDESSSSSFSSSGFLSRTRTIEGGTGSSTVLPKVKGRPEPGFRAPHVTLDQHWLRLGYLVIGLLLLARLAYLASGTIQLCEDESYQWLWSKHLALSYYSKPPLIAYTQWLGTLLWGDREFGVRFFSPIISAVMGLFLLRFFAREINARAGFFLLLVVTATPLMALGGVVMTVDPLSVLFWAAAMLAGWRAVQEGARTRDWFWVGLWMGLGFLSKYTALFQWLCWAVFFALWKPARKQLARPGPYLALLVNLLCALPVLIWNWQHGWITVSHVADDAGAGQAWQFTLKFFLEFLGSELALLNPIFFVAATWAAIAFWRRGRHNPRLVYFFSMGAPLFLVYLLYTLHSRVMPNWIAPSILPLFCLMVAYWDTRLRLGSGGIKRWLGGGLALGFVAVVLAHQTDVLRHTKPLRQAILAPIAARAVSLFGYTNSTLSAKLSGDYLPVNLDLLHRVRVWSDVAKAVGQARKELLTEGKPVFIITEHYGFAGLVSFYLPEARQIADTETPLVYYRTSSKPDNQFYFWPGYTNRIGDNAIGILELDRDDPRELGRVSTAATNSLTDSTKNWPPNSLTNSTYVWIVAGQGSNQCRRISSNTATTVTLTANWDTIPDETSRYVIGLRPIPRHLLDEFESVENLGVRDVMYHGAVCRPIQMFACRGLRQRGAP